MTGVQTCALPIYLALSIQGRNAPKLLKEVLVLEEKKRRDTASILFKGHCFGDLKQLADKHSLPLELFMFYEAKPIIFEKSDARYRIEEITKMPPSEQKKILKKEKEVVQIFAPGESEPCSIFDFDYSLISKLSNVEFRIYRLYCVPHPSLSEEIINKLVKEVGEWDKA